MQSAAKSRHLHTSRRIIWSKSSFFIAISGSAANAQAFSPEHLETEVQAGPQEYS